MKLPVLGVLVLVACQGTFEADAGPVGDAGSTSVDAGSGDAGEASDAGVDGGLIDAGSFDAGTGAFDAGVGVTTYGPWVQLTVDAHQRKVVALQGNGTVTTFTPTKPLALEAQARQTVRSIPARAFSLVVPDDQGFFFYVGGLHSNYQGNEIDRMEMPRDGGTVITTTLSHQPNMPPEGKGSGYASGNGGYLYRQYDGGLADPSEWQPYPGHQWTKNGWNPVWGFFSLTAHALQSSYPAGSYLLENGLVVSSSAQPADDYPDMESNYGVVAFDFTTRKYKTYLTTAGQDFEGSLLGSSGVSDWNPVEQTQLFFHTNAGATRIKRWNPTTGLVSLGHTTVIGGYDGSSGNGLLVRHLEGGTFLVLRQDANGPFTRRTALFRYDEAFGTGNARFVPVMIPPQQTADVRADLDALSFAVDRVNRRVFWLLFPNVGVPVRFYVSSFDSLSSWQRIAFQNEIVVPDRPYFDAWLAGNRQPLLYRDGYLYLVDGSAPGPDDPGYLNGAINWKRAKVD